VIGVRKPTPLGVQLQWWRDAVSSGDGHVDGDLPRCGWFKAREKAWSKTWLPAKVWLNQPMDWETGELQGPETFVLAIAGSVWTRELEVAERWLRLRPVPIKEWEWLRARLALHRHWSGTRTQTFMFE
jgi:hypothetical protein